MTLGERIRAERKAQHLTQQELAHRADMSLRAYISLERGEALDPHISTLRGIASGLGMPVEELITGKALAR